MAPLRILGFLVAASLALSPAECQDSGCISQNFTNKITYANCTALPHLGATLYWNYVAANNSLSVALVATPPAGGWIAYAVNLNGSGMVGAEALIAIPSNGSIPVKPFRLRSYSDVVQQNLTFPVSGLSAEASGRSTHLFAILKLPESAVKSGKINHVWQVGEVKNGVPQKHSFAQENLQSNGTLELTNAASKAPSPSGASSGNGTSGGVKRASFGLGISALLVIGNSLGLCF